MAYRHLGFACICMSLGDKVTTSRSTVLRTFTMERAESMALANCQDLIKIMEWNAANDVKFFRVSSAMFPFMTHEKVGYKLDDLATHMEIKLALKTAGDIAKKHGIRLNSHPGPFTILSSPNDKIVDATVRDIEMHSLVGDLLGNEGESLFNINFHMGSDYGDKKASAKRYSDNLSRLSENARKRLTVENDDKGKLYSVRDLYDLVYQQCGVPIVFDVHHHQFCTGAMADVDAAKLAFTTWGQYIPEIHYSESRTVQNSTLDGCNVRAIAHSDYLSGTIPSYTGMYDVMIESKAKDLSLLKYRKATEASRAS